MADYSAYVTYHICQGIVQGSAKERSLGYVIHASWLPLAAGARFTQPLDHSLADPCMILGAPPLPPKKCLVNDQGFSPGGKNENPFDHRVGSSAIQSSRLSRGGEPRGSAKTWSRLRSSSSSIEQRWRGFLVMIQARPTHYC